MAWTEIDCVWRSLVGEVRLSDVRAPLTLPVPAGAFEYGAISDPLPSFPGTVVRVRAIGHGVTAGISLCRPNGSTLLSAEYALQPDTPTDILLRPDPDLGPACLLVRNFGDAGRSGSVALSSVAAAAEADLHSETLALVLSLPPADVDSDLLDRSDLDRLPPAPPRDAVLTPVGLGNSCETKVQLCRVQHHRLNPKASHAAFRLMMLPPERSRQLFGWSLFDWQGTPFRALCAYLENDFEGVFERDDLEPDGERILHRRLGTEHHHDFEMVVRPDGPPTHAYIDEGYPAARARFEAMAEDFRRHLRTAGDFLYVLSCEDMPGERAVRRLMRQLSAHNPEHRFRLLISGFADEASDLSAVAPWVDVAWRPRPLPGQAEAHGWEGDYAAWDLALAPYRLGLPDGRVAEPAGASPTAPEPGPRPAGWFERMSAALRRRS